MWGELILLNLMAVCCSAGVVIWIAAYAHSLWGLVATVGMLVLVNWVWWSVHFNDFKLWR
jgi:hypothetical protein